MMDLRSLSRQKSSTTAAPLLAVLFPPTSKYNDSVRKSPLYPWKKNESHDKKLEEQ